jgi:twinkle protein
VVMFSAENFPPESHIASLIEKYTGQPFSKGITPQMSEQEMRRGQAFIEKHFRFINPASEGMTLDRLLAISSALAEMRPVDVLTVDPWNELHHERSQHVSETEYVSVQLTKLRRWARKHRAHVYLVAHPQKMQKDRDTGKYGVPTPYDVSGSAHWRNKADYCLTVYRDITAGDDDTNVAVHVQKVRRREMGRLGQVMLTYDKVTSEYRDGQAPRQYQQTYMND